MATFEDFQPDTDQNNRVIQMSLKEIDTEVLSTALTGLPDDTQQMVYRNVSQRVADMCKVDIETKKETISQAKIDAAQDVFLQLLNRNIQYAEGVQADLSGGTLPEIALDSDEAVISTFKSLATYVRTHGVLPLEGLEDQIDHPVMKKGIQYLADGWEPLLMRSILEKYRDAYLQSVKTRLDMILQGIDSLAAKNHPEGMEEILRGYIQEA